MLQPLIDESRKQTFRRKSRNIYLKQPQLQHPFTLNRKEIVMPSQKLPDANCHACFGTPLSSLELCPTYLPDKDRRLPESRRGQKLWKKATETLVLPLIYVRVKQKQTRRMSLRLIRQSTLKKLKVTLEGRSF